MLNLCGSPGSSVGICEAFSGCFLRSPFKSNCGVVGLFVVVTISDCRSFILSRSLSMSLRNFFTFFVSLLSWKTEECLSVSASEQGEE